MGRHRLAAARLLLIFCIAAVAALCWPQLAAAQTITEFPLPAPNKTPYGITAGPDGALWFTELDGNKIGRITTAGTITEFNIPTGGSNPISIAAGSDGALWFTEGNGNKIGRIPTTATPGDPQITEFALTAGSFPYGITAGPDGALWFVEWNGNKIGRITTAGVITEFLIPTAGSNPSDITAGPDGALWFTEHSGNKIGRITTAGAITEFDMPTALSQPNDITAGPDGALWFTENGNNKIGRIPTTATPGNPQITEFTVRTANSIPEDIVVGSDGALWFTEYNGNKIGRMTTAGAISEWQQFEFDATPGSVPLGITAGPDGALWFSERNNNTIGRLTVPQFIQQDVQSGNDAVNGCCGARQGGSVAVSADGNTAIAGTYQDNGLWGAAWIYVRSGGAWSQQGPKLLGSGACSNCLQGKSVSLSADGNTAIVGGYNDGSGVGAAWVWTRSGVDWTEQQKLVGTGADSNAGQGWSVALSADGNTAIVGGPANGATGAVWVWTRSGVTWTQQGDKLVGTGDGGNPQQGYSVALSADGNTAVVGAANDSGDTGAVWVWTRSAGIWSQQGSKLVGAGAAGAAHQGTSVAVSADGNTVIEGGYNDSAGGAAWVWTRSAGVWSQQGAKLFGSGAVGGSQGFIYQGWSVSLSADGNTALVAGYSDDFRGATWVFTRSGGVWSQQGLKLVGAAASGDAVGFSVALSADASTAVMGGPGYAGGTGAVWFFVQTPQVTGVNPNSGTVDGGTSVTISGTGFTGTTNVTFGGTAATGVTVVDPDTITATTPAHAAGLVNVAVTNSVGTGTGTGAYTYSLGSTTTLGSSSNPSVFGQSVTFTATVTAGATGTVTFKEGPTTLGADTLSGGTATFQTSTLALGGHTITAVYGGDSNFTGSTSSGLTQTVNQGATTTVVSPSANPSVFGQSVTFTATVSVTSPAAGTPTGSVSFLDGASTLGSGTLSSGVATFSTSALALGDHSITAVYGGDSNFAGSTSSILTQTVNSVPVLLVTPATNIASSGNQGGPFSPLTFQYQLSASNSSGVNYSISGLPAWLNVSPGSGTLTTSPTTVTFTVNGTANGLSGGSYPAIISFTNTTNGQGNQTRSALLTVNSGGGPAKTYVSARTGTDAGVCPLSAPCASLNYALSVTDAGGQLTILDAGVFGPIVIAQPVTIEGPKAYSAQIFADPTAQVGCIGANPPGCALANNGFAVEIAAGVNDTVKISNVLMGAGLSGGAGALKFTSGGKLQLSGNVYRGNDTATGPIVALYPNNPGTTQAQVYFSFSDIGFNGNNPNAGAIEVKPSGNTSLKLHFNHVEVHNASYGIRTDGSLLSSPSVNVATEISQSEFFSFAFAAVNAFSTAGTGATNAAFDGVRVLNANVAIKANGPQSAVILTNSTISGNGIGVQIQNGGAVYTPQNNTIYGNSTDVSGALSPTPPK